MSIAVMQPYFFPYLGYFQLLHAADNLILYPHVQYVHRSFVSRNRYLRSQTEQPYFGPQIEKQGRRGLISGVKVRGNQEWREKTLARIRNNYSRAPFFKQVEKLFSEIILYPSDFLAEINTYGILLICEYLGLEHKLDLNVGRYLEIERELSLETQEKTDNSVALDEKHRRIIKLCTVNKTSTYINPIGGKQIYNVDLLARNNVKIRFLKSLLPAYPQQRVKSFVPAMSIIDILFNCEKEHILEMLNEYEID